MIFDEEKQALISLGLRLKAARMARNETQKEFSARMFVSIPTLQKMEKGHPSIAVGTWVKALFILSRLDDLEKLLAPSGSLAEQYETEQKLKGRRRVRKKNQGEKGRP